MILVLFGYNNYLITENDETLSASNEFTCNHFILSLVLAQDAILQSLFSIRPIPYPHVAPYIANQPETCTGDNEFFTKEKKTDY